MSCFPFWFLFLIFSSLCLLLLSNLLSLAMTQLVEICFISVLTSSVKQSRLCAVSHLDVIFRSMIFPLILASYNDMEPDDLYLGNCTRWCHVCLRSLIKQGWRKPLEYQTVINGIINTTCPYMGVANIPCASSI